MNSAPHISREIIVGASEGDERAFEVIFHTYVPVILPLITSIVGAETAARDVVQDIFLNVWINRHKLPGIDDLKGWIFTLAYHQSYTWLRKRATHQKTIEGLSEQLPQGSFENSVDTQTTLKETGMLIRRAITQLTGQQQKIYRMSREEHKTIPEIAEELGLSVSTVKNTLVTALKNIRQYLENHGIILPFFLLAYGIL